MQKRVPGTKIILTYTAQCGCVMNQTWPTIYTHKFKDINCKRCIKTERYKEILRKKAVEKLLNANTWEKYEF